MFYLVCTQLLFFFFFFLIRKPHIKVQVYNFPMNNIKIEIGQHQPTLSHRKTHLTEESLFWSDSVYMHFHQSPRLSILRSFIYPLDATQPGCFWASAFWDPCSYLGPFLLWAFASQVHLLSQPPNGSYSLYLLHTTHLISLKHSSDYAIPLLKNLWWLPNAY